MTKNDQRGESPDYPDYPEVDEPDSVAGFSELQRYMYMILARWWIILLFLLAGAGAGVYWNMTAQPIYRATCTYELAHQESWGRVGDEEGGTVFPQLRQKLDRQIYTLRSGRVKDETWKNLQDTWADRLDEETPRIPNIGGRQSDKIPTMIDLHADSPNREYALAFLEEMLNVYERYQRKELIEMKDNSLEKLRDEQEQLRKDLQESRDNLRAFESEHNIRFTKTKAEFEEEFLAEMVQRKNAIRMQRTMLKSQFPFLKEANAATIRDVLALNVETHNLTGGRKREAEQIASDEDDQTRASGGSDTSAVTSSWSEETTWGSKKAKLRRLEAEYEDKLDLYKKSHPKMLELKKKIDDAERELNVSAEIALTRLHNRHEALKIQENSLDKAAHNWRRELDLSTEIQAEHEQLKAQVNHYKRLYDKVYTHILESSLMDAESFNAKTLTAPHLLGSPVAPDRTKAMTVSLFLALAASGGVIFLLEQFQSGVLDVPAIERRLGLDYLCGIPNWNQTYKEFKNKSSRIVVSRDKTNVTTEVYRTLRSSVEDVLSDSSSYALMVTSDLRGTGKSLTTLNLGVALAWTGKRVLLVDGDLRRGYLHRDMGVERGHGLAELLKGTIHDWKDVVCETSYDNLHLLQSGSFSHDLPELLSSHRLHQLFSEFREAYDLVLVDSAPVSMVVDTSVMARVCDGTMLLVDHEKAKFNDVRHAVHRLKEANVVGFCLNNIAVPRSRYGYYRYGYYHYGHYYYPYADRSYEGYGPSEEASEKA